MVTRISRVKQGLVPLVTGKTRMTRYEVSLTTMDFLAPSFNEILCQEVCTIGQQYCDVICLTFSVSNGRK